MKVDCFQNSFCFCRFGPSLRTIDKREVKVRILWKGFSLRFQIFEIVTIEAVGEKLLQQSLKSEVTHQPQLNILLILNLWKEFLQIWFEAIR